MATLDQIAAALKAADAAGNTADATRLAAAYRAAQGQQPTSSAQSPDAQAVIQAHATMPKTQPPTPQQQVDSAVEAYRVANHPEMTVAQYNDRLKGSGVTDPLNPVQIAQNDQLMGWGDEVSGLASGTAAAVSGQDFGKNYDAGQRMQEARRALGLEKGGAPAEVASVVGGLTSLGAGPAASAASTVAAKAPSLVKSVLGGAATGAGIGAVQGAGEANGDLGNRLEGAKTGAEIGGVLGAGGGAVAGTIEKIAAARAAKMGAAPAAAEIKAQATAGYDAARASNAVIDTPALQLLKDDVGKIAQDEGLLLPSGKLAGGYPRVKSALRALYEYSKGPMTVPQLLTLRKTISKVAESNDKSESRIGGMLLDQLDSWTESLPQQAFKAGDGQAAVQMLSDAKETYARAMRTKAIEKAIYKAKLDGGGDEALRAQFRSILKSDKARRGFSPDEIAGMEKFVIGGPVGGFLKTLATGRGLAGIGWGALAGGPVGAVGLPLAGATAKLGADAAARAGAERLRSMVGLGDSVAQPSLLSMQSLAPGVVLGSGPAVQQPDYLKYLMSQ